MTSRRTMLGGVASVGLLMAARDTVGQRPVKLYRIGYLSLGRARMHGTKRLFNVCANWVTGTATICSSSIVGQTRT